MANKQISVLGCGWLGKPLGRSLVNSDYKVFGSTTKPEKSSELEQLGITPVVFDVSDISPSTSLEQFFNADVLVISLPHGVRKGKANDYVTQVEAVINAAKHGKLRHMLLISTTSVYPNLNRIVTEDDADAENPIVKAEKMVLASGFPSTVVRFAGLYGPGRHPGRFLANRRDVSGANAPVNMIHLDDCIEIIKRIIANNVWNEVFNACSDEHPTKKEFYTRAALAIGLEPPAFSDEMVEYKIVSNERLKKRLGYKFIHREFSSEGNS